MKTAEDIIISKRFFELTASEKEVVKEYASTEEDYEAMRWFLLSTGKEFTAEKITPSSDLRKGVMAHLNQKQTAPRTFFLNGVGAFLFPAEKKLFQYPAFQMVAVAAVLVTIVLIYNKQSPLQNDLALNDKTTISDPQSNESASEVTQPDQLNLEQQVEGKDLEQVEKAPVESTIFESPAVVSSQEYYYREMAVAEEVKMAELDELEIMPADDAKISDNLNSGSDIVLSQSGKTLEDSDKKQDALKKNNNYAEKSNKDGTTRSETPARDDLDNAVVNAPVGAGTTTIATGSNIKAKEEGEYKTATAGGVFGDTATESSADEEEAASKLSISETKILKKLFFIVK